MSNVGRGTKNAFRNSIRTVSIILILGISFALGLVMLTSLQAVNNRIKTVSSSVGTVITVTPAGSFGGLGGGGNPFTADQIAAIEGTKHVTSVVTSVADRLTNANAATTTPSFGGFGGGGSGGGNGGRFGGSGGTTSLLSPIDLGALAQGFGGGSLPSGFTLPVEVTGTNSPTDPAVVNATKLTFTSGTPVSGSATTTIADVGSDLATKNSLHVGSTFTAYDKTFTVQGIYKTDTKRANAGFIAPIATIEKLFPSTGPTSVTVNVDTIGNVPTTVAALQSALGTKVADVTSSQSNSATVVSELNTIHTIALWGLFGAIIAAATILLLSMLMIVRERRREIGIVKAFGSSNRGVMATFVVEALTLTGLAAVFGVVLGLFLSNPISNVLVSAQGGGGSGNGGRIGDGLPGGPQGGTPPPGLGNLGGFHPGGTLHSLNASFGGGTFLYAIGGVLLIAILGSAVPSYLIAKVRPAEVLRGE